MEDLEGILKGLTHFGSSHGGAGSAASNDWRHTRVLPRCERALCTAAPWARKACDAAQETEEPLADVLMSRRYYAPPSRSEEPDMAGFAGDARRHSRYGLYKLIKVVALSTEKDVSGPSASRSATDVGKLGRLHTRLGAQRSA